jgi:hypothetical protein
VEIENWLGVEVCVSFVVIWRGVESGNGGGDGFFLLVSDLLRAAVSVVEVEVLDRRL